MLVLGLQGSPRKNGNTRFLLKAFLDACETYGASTRMIDVDRRHILPCREYVVCETKGYCPIDDDMAGEIYPLLRRAEVIVAATPVFFYGPTAQLKALIDRCQTLWARKYRLKLKDPLSRIRRGFLLSVGATGGKNLFDAIELISRYFFDAVDAGYAGSLCYRNIEHFRDMRRHPTLQQDVAGAARRIMTPFRERPTVLFGGLKNAGASQMAAAFAQLAAGNRLCIVTGGCEPADRLAPEAVRVMAEKGIDLEFRQPAPFSEVIDQQHPDVIVMVGEDAAPPETGGTTVLRWPVRSPDRNAGMDDWRRLRDLIEEETGRFVEQWLHK